MITKALDNQTVFIEAGQDFGASASGLIARISTRLHRYREYRRGVAELQACSDRSLRDLGIYRGDIRRLAWVSTYGASAK